ncbi:ferritin-like domain-containing protein [Aquimarina sp. M1]
MKKTTLEKVKEDSHDKLVEKLQEVLEKNYDAEKGYKEAMLKADNGFLSKYLKERAAMRSQFATEISDTIFKLNETPIESGSTTGVIHRTWMNIKDAFSSNSDEGILEECLRGEKASVEEYKEAMNEYMFPVDINSMLTNQLKQVEQSVSKIKKLEDIMD